MNVVPIRTLTRRAFMLGAASLGAASLAARRAARPTPTAPQLAWQRDELALLIHFGMNTFTNREWGDGTEEPGVFAPSRLDARQWARTARAAGFRVLILTAKHHDGFCLWPTRTTTHSVARSPWRAGQGDLVREFVDACRAEQLGVGLYLSPWDRHEPTYGDSPRYNDLYCAQMTELLTTYGPLREVWFDGAGGEGPNGKKQEYDWPRVWGLVRKLQPNAVMFSDAGPDVRWIGNESGIAPDTNWSTVDPTVVTAPGMNTTAAMMQMLQHGDPHGSVWRPAETDVSIRPGWFHHPADDARVKSTDRLVELYFTSVGKNSKLVLNVPPTRDGVFHDVDVSRLIGTRERLDRLFAVNFASRRRMQWKVTADRTAVAEIDLSRLSNVSIVDLREDITKGQCVARYHVEGFNAGTWRALSQGTTIGYRKIDRIAPAPVSRLRVTIDDAVDRPERIQIGVY